MYLLNSSSLWTSAQEESTQIRSPAPSGVFPCRKEHPSLRFLPPSLLHFLECKWVTPNNLVTNRSCQPKLECSKHKIQNRKELPNNSEAPVGETLQFPEAGSVGWCTPWQQWSKKHLATWWAEKCRASPPMESEVGGEDQGNTEKTVHTQRCRKCDTVQSWCTCFQHKERQRGT